MKAGWYCNKCPTISTRPRCSAAIRSEEHTSELQSRENLVCRLLLEKKNSDSSDLAVNIIYIQIDHEALFIPRLALLRLPYSAAQRTDVRLAQDVSESAG